MSLKLNRRAFQKISFKLTFYYAFVFVLSSFIILWFSYFLLAQSLIKRDHDVLLEKINNYEAIYTKGGLSELENILAEEKKSDYETQFLVRVESSSGKNIFLHVPEKMNNLPVDEVQKNLTSLKNSKPVAHFNLRGPVVDEMSEVNHFEMMNVALPNGEHLQVARTTDDRDDLLGRYLSVILPISVLALILGSIGGFVFSNRALTPLRNLIQTMKRVYSGELNARVPTGLQQDELHEITHLFNKMTDKIERLVINMQQTLDHVAHDLKTPLTRLRSSAELALLRKSSESDYRTALAETIENTSEIVSFINTIMDISEAQAGVLKLNTTRIDSHEVIAECVDLYSLAAEEKNISIQIDEIQSFSFEADRNRFKQVLFNLLDNAVKYSSSGSQIKIVSRITEGQKQISISDQGIGISEEDLEKIWDRLYRGSNSQIEKGLGLGLSLVQSICKAHGWKIRAKSLIGKGSEFILTLN